MLYKKINWTKNVSNTEGFLKEIKPYIYNAGKSTVHENLKAITVFLIFPVVVKQLDYLIKHQP